MRHLCVRVLMVMIAAVTLLAGMASSASAAGDPRVDRLIVTNALPGWTQVSDAALEPTVANERRAVGAVTNLTFQVGVEGWRQADQSLIVVLISFPDGVAPSGFRARDAVIGACGAASHRDPVNMHSYPLITGSTEAQCSGKTTTGVPIDAGVMSWQKQSIFALVIGNHFTATELERFSVAQDAALPGGGSSTPTTSGGTSKSAGTSKSGAYKAGEVVGALILVALVGGIVFLLIARRRAKMPAPVQALSGPPGAAPYSPFAPPAAAPVPTPGAAPPGSPYARPEPAPQPLPTAAPAPGWQPIDGDPTRIAYWDGTSYSAWKRWDGSNWID